MLRELIAEEDEGTPGGFSRPLVYEVAAILAVSVPTAENMMYLAQELKARLPGHRRPAL